MQSRSERDIDQIFHTEITASHYTLNNVNNTITYRFNQKLNINTVNLTQFSVLNAFPNVS